MEWLILSLFLIGAVVLGVYLRTRKTSQRLPEPVSKVTPVASPFSLGLSKSRGNLGHKLGRFLGVNRPLSDEEWTKFEEALLTSDVGVKTTQRLLESVRRRLSAKSPDSSTSIRALLVEEAIEVFPKGPQAFLEGCPEKPIVISVIGVNGAGKTTTIGKLCQRFLSENKSVLVGAADTFRAAAVNQLKVWAERADADFVSGKEGTDPSAVVFDALTAAKARGKDIVLIDTAGRLHTQTNLMEELKKIHRVMKKVIPSSPHEVLLVIDGTLGQNSLAQARQFGRELGVTGMVVTKLDGTAKGGAVLGIVSELSIPVRFVGVGEGLKDLLPFDAKNFVEALIGAT